VNGDGELELFEWLELAAIVFLGKDDQEVPMEMFSHLNDDTIGAITTDSLFSSASRLFARVGRDFSTADAESMIAAIASTGEAKSGDFLALCSEMGFYTPSSD
jgi:Ca2+-binding EF-hand superfamily protein